MAVNVRARGPWLLMGTCLCIETGLITYALTTGAHVDLFVVVMATFPVVGALIASRSPDNKIGWIMLGVGLVSVVDSLLLAYADYGLRVNPGSLPGPELALALSAPMWVPYIGLPGTFLLLLFPDGHLPSPRWKAWAWLCGVGMAAAMLSILILPGRFADLGYPNVSNPLGIEALRPMADVLPVPIALIPIGIAGCAVALIKRFRRSGGRERLQLKWLSTAAAITATIYFVAMAATLNTDAPWDGTGPWWVVALQSASLLSLALMPLAIGVAILRYRLYEIDFLINRALVYGALTAVLTVNYFIAVTVLSQVFRPLGESQLAVAGSTLAVAALFRPVRRRLQEFIDRRFYRQRYNATRTLEAFSARLRDEMDLDALKLEITAVVDDAMQPRHVSLWLRDAIFTRGDS